MALQDHVYPQSGDPNDAARFGQLIGHNTLLNYVESGLAVTPDFTNSVISVSEGVCYLSSPSSVATTGGFEIESVGYAVQVSARSSVSITDGDNFIVVQAAIGERDTTEVVAYNDPVNAPDESLVIAYVDTTAETVEARNRNPTSVFQEITITDVLTSNGEINANGDITLSESLKTDSGDLLYDSTDDSVTLPGTLDVSGKITTDSGFEFSGDLTIPSSIVTSGGTTLYDGSTSTITAPGGVTTNGTSTFNNKVSVKATLDLVNDNNITNVGEIGAQTVTATNATVTTAPSSDTDVARKTEVDTVSSDLSTHKSDETNPHNVTSAQTGADSALSTHSSKTSNVHGIGSGETIATVSDVDAVSNSLSTHETATNGVHGIGTSETIATVSDVDSVSSSLSTHESATSGVHGIGDSDSILSESTFTDHTDSGSGVHGVASDDTVAGQSAVDTVQGNLDTHKTASSGVHGVTSDDTIAAVSDVNAAKSTLDSNKLDKTSYTPVSDVDAEVSDAASSVSGLDSQVSQHSSDISTLEANLLDVLQIPTRTSDPSNPENGQMWIRSDL